MLKPFDVFILAAGKGERLRPLTLTTPKPLLTLKERPLLDWVIEPLKTLPVKRLVINAWHLKEQIVSYAETLQKDLPFPVTVSVEEDLLGTGGGLKQALRFIDTSRVLMMNGDCFWRGDLAKFIQRAEAHQETEGSWWLTERHDDQTEIGVRDSEIVQIGKLWKSAHSKHSGHDKDSSACFSGIQWFRQIHKQRLPDQGCIVRDYWIPVLGSGQKLGGIAEGLTTWSDIGTPERLKAFRDFL